MINLNMIWLKNVFCIYTNPLKTFYDLIKKTANLFALHLKSWQSDGSGRTGPGQQWAGLVQNQVE